MDVNSRDRENVNKDKEKNDEENFIVNFISVKLLNIEGKEGKTQVFIGVALNNFKNFGTFRKTFMGTNLFDTFVDGKGSPNKETCKEVPSPLLDIELEIVDNNEDLKVLIGINLSLKIVVIARLLFVLKTKKIAILVTNIGNFVLFKVVNYWNVLQRNNKRLGIFLAVNTQIFNIFLLIA